MVNGGTLKLPQKDQEARTEQMACDRSGTTVLRILPMF